MKEKMCAGVGSDLTGTTADSSHMETDVKHHLLSRRQTIHEMMNPDAKFHLAATQRTHGPARRWKHSWLCFTSGSFSRTVHPRKHSYLLTTVHMSRTSLCTRVSTSSTCAEATCCEQSRYSHANNLDFRFERPRNAS